MLGWLTDLVSGSPVTYLVVMAVAAVDVLCPIVPAEAVLITSGILAARGGVSLWLLIPAAAIGGFAGDNLVFRLGRGVGDPIAARVFRSDRGQQRLALARGAIGRHGPVLVVVARFLPGGRSATTFAGGTLEMDWRRFAAADAAAATAWALYASLLGYLGGSSFQHSLWKPLVLSLGIGMALGAIAEVYRRLQRRRGRDILGDQITTKPAGGGRRRPNAAGPAAEL